MIGNAQGPVGAGPVEGPGNGGSLAWPPQGVAASRAGGCSPGLWAPGLWAGPPAPRAQVAKRPPHLIGWVGPTVPGLQTRRTRPETRGRGRSRPRPHPHPRRRAGRGVQPGLAPRGTALLRSPSGRALRTTANHWPGAHCPLNDTSLSLACAGQGGAPLAWGLGGGAAVERRQGWNASGGPTPDSERVLGPWPSRFLTSVLFLHL